MNNAWEITPDDIQNVAECHNVDLDDDQALKLLREMVADGTQEEIVDNVLRHCDLDEQVSSMNDDIEKWLRKKGIIHS